MSSAPLLKVASPTPPEHNDLRAADGGEPSHDDDTVTVYARWIKARPLANFTNVRGGKMHVYAVPVRPMRPLQVGLRVRVLALSRVAFHTPAVVFPRYETYNPHVVGFVVAAARSGDGEYATFEVDNECGMNPVRKVKLTIWWIPDITARLLPTEGEHVNETQPERGLPLEDDVTVAVQAQGLSCDASGCVGQPFELEEQWTEFVTFD